MQVTAEIIKRYLIGYSADVSIFYNDLESIEFAKGRATKTTTHVTGMPGGGGSSRDDIYIALIDLKNSLKGTQEFIRNYRRNILFMIESSVPEDLEKRILIERHIHMKRWSAIKEIEGAKELSERQIYRKYNDALSACAEWVNTNKPYFLKDILKYV